MGRRGAAGYVVRPPNTCPPGRRDSVAHAPDTKSPRTTRTTTRQDLVRAARNPLDDSALPRRDRSRSREDPELLEASTTARCILTCRHSKLDPDAGWSALAGDDPQQRGLGWGERCSCPRIRKLHAGRPPTTAANAPAGRGGSSNAVTRRATARGRRQVPGATRPRPSTPALTSVAREYADPRSAGSFGHNTWSRNTSAAAT